MRKQILVLGATGSIGTQTLDILRFSFDYELLGVSLRSRFERLEPYLLFFDTLKYVAITDEEKAKEFKQKHPSYIVFSGDDASLQLLKACPKADVFNSLMGNCGLLPSLLAIEQNQDLMLSNKESIVIGSSLLEKALRKSTSHLYPVDSEHVALAKILSELNKEGIPKQDVEKIVVTASGGSLRDCPKEELAGVTPEIVLHHPTWAMGKKITVDSATLVNKGFEVIEASYLFSYPLEKVDAIICRESLVHALVRYKKNGEEKTMMEYSPCDMKVSIAYALSKGTLGVHQNNEDDKRNIGKLHFATIDHTFYPCFDLTINMFKRYGNVGMIYYNAVDSEAIASFLDGKIPFLGIYEALKKTYGAMPKEEELTIDNVNGVIQRAERFALSIVRN